MAIYVYIMILHCIVLLLFAIDVPGSNVEVGFQAIQSLHLGFRELEVEHFRVLSDSSCARGNLSSAGRLVETELRTWGIRLRQR